MGPSLGWSLWTGAARTSENAVKGKFNFAEFTFYTLQ